MMLGEASDATRRVVDGAWLDYVDVVLACSPRSRPSPPPVAGSSIRLERRISIGRKRELTPVKSRRGCSRTWGCTYALVAHSERRQLFGETDRAPIERCSPSRTILVLVLCVGESDAERDRGVTFVVGTARSRRVQTPPRVSSTGWSSPTSPSGHRHRAHRHPGQAEEVHQSIRSSQARSQGRQKCASFTAAAKADNVDDHGGRPTSTEPWSGGASSTPRPSPESAASAEKVRF
jgi:hypothetical protein